MDTSRARLRFQIINLLLWLSFLAACLFYGVAENLLLLFVSAGLLLAAAVLVPVSQWQQLYQQQPLALWLSGYVLIVLTLSYQLISISPDNSFAMSWIIAALPICYLVCCANPYRQTLLIALAGTISLFVCHSALQFFADGQRAYEPLGDPNHYASMLYLVWIPLAHHLLIRSAPVNARDPRSLFGNLLLCLFALVIAATGSRVGVFILVAALFGWLLLLVRARRPLWRWLLLALNTAGAFAVWWLVAPAAVSGTVDAADFQSGVGIRGALNSAALQMLLENPLTGSGLFTFPLLYPLFRLTGDQSTAGVFVHNDYLQLLLETGPWLVAALLVLGLAVARCLWLALFKPTEQHLAKFGLAMAAAALLAHSAVNYVLYFLPLALLLAVVCAELFAPDDQSGSGPAVPGDAEPEAPPAAAKISVSQRAAWLSGVLLALSAWSYLGLDVVTQGVFGGQAAPGFVAEFKRDVPAMLNYAATAEQLNDKRVTPILAQALLYTSLLESNPGSGVSKAAILERYRKALLMDPYNPMVYQQLYDFVSRFGDAQLLASLRPEETPEMLLRNVVALELGRTPSIFRLAAYYDEQDNPEQALRMLEEQVFPWLERIHWSQPANARAVMAEMVRRALAADDQEFLLELQQLDERLQRLRPETRRERLREWQQTLWR